MRITTRTAWLGGAFVLFASAGAGLWVHEAHIACVVAREMEFLDAARPVTEDSRRVEAAIADLHALLATCGSDDANHGVPWKWALGFEAVLRDEVEWNAPFFGEVDGLVASGSFQRVLASGARLDSVPRLGPARARTNLLCARAVLDARAGRGAEAARRLGQALDLTRVQFGPDAVSALISVSLDAIVLDACRFVLASKPGAGEALARELLPRVAWGDASERYLQSLRGEAVSALQLGYGGVPPEAWYERWQLRRLALGRLAALEAGAAPVVDLPSFDAHGAVSYARALGESRFAVTDVALRAAAYAHEHGTWPASLGDIVPPGSDSRVRAAGITWSVRGDEGRLVAAIEPNTNYLGEWTLR